MTRLLSSIFAAVFALSFGACEQHTVSALPPHYQHKMHHGPEEPAQGSEAKGEYYPKDPNRVHEEKAIPPNPAANPGPNPVMKP